MGGVRTARPVRQFDASLGTPLFTLPSTALPDSNPMSLLSSRNLLRGRKMGLPSGQQVARLMGVTPLTNAQLWQDHRIEVKIPIPTSGPGANVVEILREFDVENQNLKQLLADPGWNGEAPLWFYILKEAEIVGRGRELGPVGGRIVAEVLVGLLQRDLNSVSIPCSPPGSLRLRLRRLAASSPWPISSSTPESGPDERSSEGTNMSVQEQIAHVSPRRRIVRRIGAAGMALAAILTLGACKATGGGTSVCRWPEAPSASSRAGQTSASTSPAR